MEMVSPVSSSTARASRARLTAGGAPCSRRVPERSRKASSMEIGSTSGVKRSMMRRMRRPSRAYFALSGRMTTRSGHNRRAVVMGMAERMPKVRAT